LRNFNRAAGFISKDKGLIYLLNLFFLSLKIYKMAIRAEDIFFLNFLQEEFKDQFGLKLNIRPSIARGNFIDFLLVAMAKIRAVFRNNAANISVLYVEDLLHMTFPNITPEYLEFIAEKVFQEYRFINPDYEPTNQPRQVRHIVVSNVYRGDIPFIQENPPVNLPAYVANVAVANVAGPGNAQFTDAFFTASRAAVKADHFARARLGKCEAIGSTTHQLCKNFARPGSNFCGTHAKKGL
jgi:hypothetical protein